jgi:alpha-glucosidase
MQFVKFMPDGSIFRTVLAAGHHYVEIALNEVPLFIRKGKCIPIVDAAEWVDAIDMSTVQMLGYENATYDLYEDDGITPVH